MLCRALLTRALTGDRTQINQKYALLPIRNFYNKEVSDKLNLEQDYVTWLTSPNTFSFCRHPFILTPVRDRRSPQKNGRIRDRTS